MYVCVRQTNVYGTYVLLYEILGNLLFIIKNCYVHCTEFQRKVFKLLESNSYRLQKLSKDMLLVKSLLRKQGLSQESAPNNFESTRIEVFFYSY